MNFTREFRKRSFYNEVKTFVLVLLLVFTVPKFLYAVDVMNVAELRQEITDINNGQDDNVINLAAPMFIVMDEDPVEQMFNAFPRITSEMTIQKDSSLNDEVLIKRDSADDFRFFQVTNSGKLTLSDVVLDNGGVVDFGGAVRVEVDSDLSLENVTIINSEASLGGGVDVVLARINIDNSKIGLIGMGNKADTGGGINVDNNSVVTIDDTIIEGNIADSGGGVSNDASLTITDSSIQSNVASSNVGGGILNNEGSILMITNSTIQMNEANNAGGGIYNDSTLTVIRSTVGPGNISGGGGGGGLVNNMDRNMTLRNTTISNNTSQGVGGGIENFGNLTMNNVTIGFNEANIDGGGLWNFGNDVNITNTLIGQNMAVNDGDDCHSNVTITTDNTNLIEKQANFCLLDGPAITELSPQLGSLALNSNPNNTFTNAIPMMSPAFNAGNNNTCESVDQRGISRPQGESCDIGAYELLVENGGGGGNEFAPGDANGDGVFDVGDIIVIINAILMRPLPNGNADCNEDGLFDVGDIICVIPKILAQQ